MAKARKNATPRTDAGTLITVRLEAKQAAKLREVSRLAGVPVDTVAAVLLAIGILRETAAQRGAGAGKVSPP